MTGICGVLGGDQGDLDEMAPYLDWSGRERHTISHIPKGTIRSAFLPENERSPPVEVGGLDIWLWGDVFGIVEDGKFRSCADKGIAAEDVIARCYRSGDIDGFAKINGNFFAVIYDRSENTLSFVTDRFGSRDVYHTRGANGTFVFSSRIHSIPKHPSVTPAFDDAYLLEYLYFRRTFGTKTPLEDVYMFPPASVTTFDLSTKQVQHEQYWQPTYTPDERPYATIVDEFVALFREIVDDIIPRQEHGALLLSGGADSRLLLAVLGDHEITAYHMADWMSREARIAERLAMHAGVPFRFLRRDLGYVESLLSRTPAKNNFVQRFTQAHADGFIETIQENHDYVLTNHLADVLFQMPTPNRSLSIGPLGPVDLPIQKQITSFAEFIDHTEQTHTSQPDFLAKPLDIRTILTTNINRQADGFHHHGVQYPSFEDLVTYRRAWPGTHGTDTFFRRSIAENITHYMPLLDIRMIDFWQTVPKRYYLRQDFIGAALDRLAPDLAEIPHAGTGVPLSRPFPVNYLEAYLIGLVRKIPGIRDPPPLPTLDHEPWGNKEGILREQSFIEDLLHEKAHVFEEIPVLDYQGAIRCYEAHKAGEDWSKELLTLATFLSMPVTEQVVTSSTN